MADGFIPGKRNGARGTEGQEEWHANDVENYLLLTPFRNLFIVGVAQTPRYEPLLIDLIICIGEIREGVGPGDGGEGRKLVETGKCGSKGINSWPGTAEMRPSRSGVGFKPKDRSEEIVQHVLAVCVAFGSSPEGAPVALGGLIGVDVRNRRLKSFAKYAGPGVRAVLVGEHASDKVERTVEVGNELQLMGGLVAVEREVGLHVHQRYRGVGRDERIGRAWHPVGLIKITGRARTRPRVAKRIAQRQRIGDVEIGLQHEAVGFVVQATVQIGQDLVLCISAGLWVDESIPDGGGRCSPRSKGSEHRTCRTRRGRSPGRSCLAPPKTLPPSVRPYPQCVHSGGSGRSDPS